MPALPETTKEEVAVGYTTTTQLDDPIRIALFALLCYECLALSALSRRSFSPADRGEESASFVRSLSLSLSRQSFLALDTEQT